LFTHTHLVSFFNEIQKINWLADI